MVEQHPKGLRTWITLDTAAFAHNVNTFRSLIGDKVKFCLVLKSNAYGHEILDIAHEAEKLNVDALGVDSITEALALREAHIRIPIIVLGYTLPELLPVAVEHHIAVTFSHLHQLDALCAAGAKEPITVHIKIDTGMHRQGFLPDDRDVLISGLQKHRRQITVAGLFTHFAAAGNPAFSEYTNEQRAEFLLWQQAFYNARFSPTSHTSATAGTLLYPDTTVGMVRVGIGCYGLWPSKESEVARNDRIILRPVLSWKTIISETKRLPKGAKIGYDCTEVLQRNSLVGVCPIGYWHGYPRALSSIGHVLINGKRARVLGRVSMDMISVDLTDVGKVDAETIVTLVGRDDQDEISIPWLSGLIDMSPYEFVTRINPLIKRILFQPPLT